MIFRHKSRREFLLMSKNKSNKAKGSPLLLVLELALAGVMLFCLGKIGYTLLQYRKGADT